MTVTHKLNSQRQALSTGVKCSKVSNHSQTEESRISIVSRSEIYKDMEVTYSLEDQEQMSSVSLKRTKAQQLLTH